MDEERWYRAIGHNASDYPLQFLILLFIAGAIYGFLAYYSEHPGSPLKTPFKNFWQSCAVSIGWAFLYTITYEQCQLSPKMIKTMLIINYGHAIITAVRFAYCLYLIRKEKNKQDTDY